MQDVFCPNYDCDAHGKPFKAFHDSTCPATCPVCGEEVATVKDFLSDPPEWYIADQDSGLC